MVIKTFQWNKWWSQWPETIIYYQVLSQSFQTISEKRRNPELIKFKFQLTLQVALGDKNTHTHTYTHTHTHTHTTKENSCWNANLLIKIKLHSSYICNCVIVSCKIIIIPIITITMSQVFILFQVVINCFTLTISFNPLNAFKE